MRDKDEKYENASSRLAGPAMEVGRPQLMVDPNKYRKPEDQLASESSSWWRVLGYIGFLVGLLVLLGFYTFS